MLSGTEIDIYYFSCGHGEYIDVTRDVGGTVGVFTWRRKGQEVPPALKLVVSTTLDDLADANTIAKYIRDHFMHSVNEGVSKSIARELFKKVYLAREQNGPDFKYEHSERHRELVARKILD